MAYWNRQKTYTVDKPVVAFVDGVAAPYSVTINSDDFNPNYKDDNKGKKTYPAGHFICKQGSSIRFLPRSKVVTTGFTTSSTSGIIDNPYLFKAGDVIKAYDTTSKTPTFTTIGTIQFINYETGFINLTANAAVNAPVGTGVAVDIPMEDILGVHEHSLDFEERPIQNIAVISKAHGVYKTSLPVVDAQLEEYFRSSLNIREKF